MELRCRNKERSGGEEKKSGERIYIYQNLILFTHGKNELMVKCIRCNNIYCWSSRIISTRFSKLMIIPIMY